MRSAECGMVSAASVDLFPHFALRAPHSDQGVLSAADGLPRKEEDAGATPATLTTFKCGVRNAECGVGSEPAGDPRQIPHSALRIPHSVEGRPIQAGGTGPENRIGIVRGRGSTDAFRHFQTLNERKSHETRAPLPKSVALSQELQTKSCDPNQAGEVDLCLSAGALRFETANQNV